MTNSPFTDFVRRKMQQNHTHTVSGKRITSWTEAVFKTADPEVKDNELTVSKAKRLRSQSSEISPTSVMER